MDIQTLTLQEVSQLVENSKAHTEGTRKTCYELPDMSCIVVLKEWASRNEQAFNIHSERLQKSLDYLRRVKGVRCHKLIKYFYDADKYICYKVFTKAPGEEMLLYLCEDSNLKVFIKQQEKCMDKLLLGPQEHFDEFVRATCEILKQGMTIEFFCRNFMYDKHYGFTFIDLDLPNGVDEKTSDFLAHSPSSISNIFWPLVLYSEEKSQLEKLNNKNRNRYYGKRTDIFLKFAQGMVNNGFSLDALKASISIIRERFNWFDFLNFKPDFDMKINSLKPQVAREQSLRTIRTHNPTLSQAKCLSGNESSTMKQETRATWLR